MLLLSKANVERVHKAKTVRRTITYSYWCITNLVTLGFPPLSSIKYDIEHLVMLGLFLAAPMSAMFNKSR